MLMLLLVLMLMLIGMLMRRLMLNLTLELMSQCVLMLMVMLMVMLSWVGGGGDGHLFFDAAGTECAHTRATFGCFKPARDHETREALSNRLCSTIASTTDLFNLFYVVEITGDQQ